MWSVFRFRASHPNRTWHFRVIRLSRCPFYLPFVVLSSLLFAFFANLVVYFHQGVTPPSSVCYSWDSRYTLGREELASILAYFLDSFPEALSSLWRVRRGIRIPILLYRSVFYLLNYPPLRCWASLPVYQGAGSTMLSWRLTLTSFEFSFLSRPVTVCLYYEVSDSAIPPPNWYRWPSSGVQFLYG